MYIVIIVVYSLRNIDCFLISRESHIFNEKVILKELKIEIIIFLRKTYKSSFLKIIIFRRGCDR